ncbi:MAG: Mrp/NBP35 family ATP-binding protein [Chthonomonas sp.]|nr:Mrp/NBP35 family ATP-binding protein [Chthonomonas sp.]
MAPTVEDVLQSLRQVQDPDLRRDIVSLNFVKDVVVNGAAVAFTVELTTPACPVKEQLEQQCHDVVAALEGVSQVSVTMTAQTRTRQTEAEDLIPQVKQCIAIASGKGGVGKSTVALNLAVALAETGARVGLMDADVYGPSIPMMMGTQGDRPFTRNQRIVPIERFGIASMSLGYLMEEGQSVLWRGPMVAGTVRQLLADVEWGELDYLLVDLPPGTGDAPMSLAQLVPLTGVAIVSTPQTVAANIAGKCAALFRRLNSPILGVIENMADYACPNCGHESRLFRGLSGEELSANLKVPYLGSIPLDPAIGESQESGQPAVLTSPESHQAKAFRAVAGRLAAQASIVTSARAQ